MISVSCENACQLFDLYVDTDWVVFRYTTPEYSQKGHSEHARY
jgi:hypothetical protein